MGDDLAKINALILFAKNLSKLKPKDIFEIEIREKCLNFFLDRQQRQTHGRFAMFSV